MSVKHLLPRSTPEAQGISSNRILAFIDEVETSINELHSFMLLRHGNVVAEGWWDPYAPQHPHILFSLTKSFTSTAVGLAVAEGRLSIDDFVLSFFPEDAPKRPSKNLASMRVRHLLAMATGHLTDSTERTVTNGQGNWVKGFFSMPVKHAPGAPFVYNSGASHILSAIVQKVTGMPIKTFLTSRLFEPLGIEDPKWETDPQGINIGGWGLSLKTEDIARFGQLYLQKGTWNGKQLLPFDWVEQATSKQVRNDLNPDTPIDWQQGYGFQFWRCQHNAYRGDGAFGQFCIVMPEQDVVLAITSGVNNMQAVLDLVWKHFQTGMSENPLPENFGTQEKLTEQLSSLLLKPPDGNIAGSLGDWDSKKIYTLNPNPLDLHRLQLSLYPDRCHLVFENQNNQHILECGKKTWLFSNSSFSTNGRALNLANSKQNNRIAAAFAWVSQDTLDIRVRYYETPFFDTITCKFEGNQIKVQTQVNVSFGPTEQLNIEGTLVQ